MPDHQHPILKKIIVWGLLTFVLAALIYNRHKHTGTFNWLTPLWADQAGYYVYLPALFVYEFDADKFPEGIDRNTGEGFSLDRKKNKVITRYSCGVAIMQAPFFLTIHAIAGISSQPRDGFSGIYHQVPNLAALFYTIIGLFFLWQFLKKYYKWHISATTILILFLGTNLYYYATDSTGMSHIYSFALFAAIARTTQKMLAANKQKQGKYVMIWCLLFALIVLTRPTNVLILPFLFTLEIKSSAELKSRIFRFVTFKNALLFIISFLVVFIPQLLYWQYVSGEIIHYSYGEYGFSNFTSPKILQLWFSPNNGLFLYNPLYLVVLTAMIIKIFDNTRNINNWIIPVTFILLSYVFASWYIFSFGCGYGSRNFVEYNVMFALPVASFLKRTNKWQHLKRVSFILLIISMVIFNLRLIVLYSRCYQGNDWDFKEYVTYFTDSKKYRQSLKIPEVEQILSTRTEYSNALHINSDILNSSTYKKAVVNIDFELNNPDSKALLVLAIENQDSMIYWNSIRLSESIPESKLNVKQQARGEFWLPEELPSDSRMATYVWNLNKDSLSVYNLKITLQ